MKKSEPKPYDTFILKNAYQKFGSSPALISDNISLSYSEYFNSVKNTAQNMADSGFGKDDKIAIFSPPNIKYAVLVMAMNLAGITAVPVSTRFPAKLIKSLLNNIRCKNIILTDQYKDAIPEEEFNLIQPEKLITVSEKDSAENKIWPGKGETVLFTSGSTGQNKAVLLSNENHYFSALGSNKNIHFLPGDSWMLSLPLYHAGGLSLLYRAALGGGAVVFPEENNSLEKSILKYNPTHLSLVSTQLYRLLQKNDVIPALKIAKFILLGGGPASPAVIKKSLENGVPLFTTYGCTEAGSQVCTSRPGDDGNKLYTSGKTLPYRECRISTAGEILFKGKTLFTGYIEDGKLNPCRDKDGWFHSGDCGEFDKEGYLAITGRKDEMFLSGGENIHPEEIEEHLCEIPGIIRAVVVPVKNEEFGYRPAAFIELSSDFSESADFSGVKDHSVAQNSIKQILEKTLPKFKIPDIFYPWPKEIKDQGLKPDRIRFKELAIKSAKIQ